MENEDKLIEAMAALVTEVHELRKELSGARAEIAELKLEQQQTTLELAKVIFQLTESNRTIKQVEDASIENSNTPHNVA